jgi:4-hydroxybenzoyl-CoA thioesterase
MQAFTSEMQVLFRHCDPAGIVFYPRYFEMLNDFVEQWFDQGLGLSFQALHVQRRIGTPTVSLQCDFVAPSRWNDRLRQELEVRHIGGASFGLAVRFLGQGGQPRLSARLTMVTMDLERMRARPLPEDLRERMQAYLLPVSEPGPITENRENP